MADHQKEVGEFSVPLPVVTVDGMGVGASERPGAVLAESENPQDVLSVFSGKDGVMDAVVLRLDDLLPDAEGEVVLFAGEGPPINVKADESIVDSGVAAAHTTATGVDVTGYAFYSFDSGITLYVPADLEFTVNADIS